MGHPAQGEVVDYWWSNIFTKYFQVADVVYAEFHEQGDVEKLLGWKPIPLFDRDNYPELASMQVRTICTMFQCTRVLFRVPQF